MLPTIDLIHDTRYLCTPFRIDGIKAMSRGILDKICQCLKSRSTLLILSKRNDDLIVMQMYGLSFDKINVIIAFCEDIYGHRCIQKK